ncbi:MAG: molybdate ABC transporter substrate-binding protein [Candidatus Bathyarchaeia archaeon]|jgi:molybdate transport system substrate-binding protein
MNHKNASIIIIAIIICASLIGYMAYSGTFSATPKTELRIFMASSLINAVTNMTTTFEQENNCRLIVNSAGSNTLYQQITSGSPCDVFMAADFKWTKQLNDSNLLLGGYKNFTSNRLEVLLPGDNPQNITSLLDLIKPGVKIVVADNAVPVGSYTNKTVTKIDATWGNSSSPLYKGAEWDGFKEKFYSNVVSYEATVEDVVGKVALNLGTVDVGVAFVSDATYGAMSGAQLLYVEVPNDVNTIGTYGIAVVGSTTNSDLAQKYMDFWLSTQGQTLLNTFGFGT